MEYSQAKQCIQELGRDKMEELIETYSAEALEAAIECGVNLEDFEEAYQGSFKSDGDFAEEMAESMGSIDRNAAWPNSYIDWERAARDLMMDYSEHNGHYFRNL